MWQLFDGNINDWEQMLLMEDGQHYLVGKEWLDHMTNQGWNAERYIYKNEQRSFLCQGFYKKYFGLYIYWFPEWILGDYEKSKELLTYIKEQKRRSMLYLRLRSHREKNLTDMRILESCFNRPKIQIDSGKTMLLDLQENEVNIHNNLRKNWKRNLRRADRLKHEIVKISDVKTIISLYEKLAEIKNISAEIYNPSEIRSLFDSFSKNISVYGARTEDGEVHAIRGAIIKSHKSIDIFAAADSVSRKNYLSYSLFWYVLMRAKKKSNIYDLNGVDEKNLGVYNFKKGTGALLEETIGEYDFSSNFLVKFVISLYMRFKHKKS